MYSTDVYKFDSVYNFEPISELRLTRNVCWQTCGRETTVAFTILYHDVPPLRFNDSLALRRQESHNKLRAKRKKNKRFSKYDKTWCCHNVFNVDLYSQYRSGKRWVDYMFCKNWIAYKGQINISLCCTYWWPPATLSHWHRDCVSCTEIICLSHKPCTK